MSDKKFTVKFSVTNNEKRENHTHAYESDYAVVILDDTIYGSGVNNPVDLLKIIGDATEVISEQAFDVSKDMMMTLVYTEMMADNVLRGDVPEGIKKAFERLLAECNLYIIKDMKDNGDIDESVERIASKMNPEDAEYFKKVMAEIVDKKDEKEEDDKD